MAQEHRSDDVEKILSDESAIKERKQALIAELLKQKEAAAKDFDQKKQAALKEFDDKLAKLDYRVGNSGRPKRSHHKKASAFPSPSVDDKKDKNRE